MTHLAFARRLRWLGVATIGGSGFTGPALAQGIIVVPSGVPSIHAAVNQALPGDTIIVLPGTYTEEVVIDKDLTLKGGGPTTVIKSPPTLTPSAQESLNGKPVAAVVRITDGAHARMSGFTVTGPLPCGVNVDGASVAHNPWRSFI